MVKLWKGKFVFHKIKNALGIEKSKKIEVINRKTGEKFIEKIYGEDAMKLFYGKAWMAQVTEKLLTRKFLSNVYGAFNDSQASKHKIPEFIKTMEISEQECEKDVSEYNSFNEFFARKLKPDARPIDNNPLSIISPSDGRLLVFPKLEDSTLSYVKWASLKLRDLFHENHNLANRFRNGSCAVLRLCPADYHRFHFPVSGVVGVTKSVPGLLHSVSPFALEHKIPVYCMNKRAITELDSPVMGKVVLMEVGALFIGSIVQTHKPSTEVTKGEEKGFFKFGGSTCILFFEPNSVQFDPDLVKNSLAGFETLVCMGEKIATIQAQS